MQIRTKLTLQFITIVAGILVLALCFTYIKFRQFAEDEFYAGLRSKALMTAEMVLADESNFRIILPAERAGADAEILPFHENVVIYNAERQKIFTYNPAAVDFDEAAFAMVKNGGECHFAHGRFHALALQHRSRTGREYYIIAEAVFKSEELMRLRNILILSFFLGVAIVAAGGWFYAGQALAPVLRIVNQVDAILPSDLSKRLDAPNSHDEISRLVLTFNRLLDRILLAFRMQRSFISNVSHELKNPLSVIISQLEVALAKPRTADEYRTALGSVLEDAHALGDVADKLLQLARVHSDGNNIAFEPVRLDEVMLQTRGTLLRLHPDYQIAFDIDGVPENEEQLCVSGNEPLLRTALLNLIDNGCKFSPDKRVDVLIYFDAGGRHRVEIADHGPGIAAKDLQMIFQPFYRGAQNLHVRGSGIGLSLVDSILRLHRVAVKVISEPGAGTKFQLDFPGSN
jgi:signal transduction histidine kinase